MRCLVICVLLSAPSTLMRVPMADPSRPPHRMHLQPDAPQKASEGTRNRQEDLTFLTSGRCLQAHRLQAHHGIQALRNSRQVPHLHRYHLSHRPLHLPAGRLRLKTQMQVALLEGLMLPRVQGALGAVKGILSLIPLLSNHFSRWVLEVLLASGVVCTCRWLSTVFQFPFRVCRDRLRQVRRGVYLQACRRMRQERLLNLVLHRHRRPETPL